MIKGKRTSGNTLRRDLREIVKVLFRKNALDSLEEANALFIAIPTIKELDERYQEDAEVIALFRESSPPLPTTLAPSPGSTSVSSADLLPTSPSLPARTKSSLPLKRVNWIISGVVCVVLIGGLLVGLLVVTHAPTFSSPSPTAKTTTGCANATNGVILYTDVNYQGQCHVFPPGSYELAQFGLEENVSSLKDPNKAYHVTFYSKSKNTYYADADIPAFSPDWDNLADTMLVEKHRPTTCQPGANGVASSIDTNDAGGYLFMTEDILDLTPLDFDQIITSLRFVGSYRKTRQLVLYTRPNHQDECGAYWQDQPDLLQCARKALSLQVRPFTPSTPVTTVLHLSEL